MRRFFGCLLVLALLLTSIGGFAEVADKETQVLVVGSGIAGLMAANSAADAGAKVLVIEKMAFTGGTTRISGGYLHAVGTENDLENTINTTEDMLVYWKSIADHGRDTGYPDYSRVESIYKTNADNIEYLRAQGVPLVEPFAGSYTMVYSENGGVGLVEALEAAARSKGVEFILECNATELLVEGEKIVGVRVEQKGKSFNIKAGSTVMCTGGFSQNPEMVAKYAPELTGTISTAAVSSTGDGILMMEAVGAAKFDNNWFAICPMRLSNDYMRALAGKTLPFAGQLGVNSKGQRYMSEQDTYPYQTTYETILDGVEPHYFLFDSSNEELLPLLEAGIDLGETVKADDLNALAEAAGIDTAAFTAAVEKYNAMSEAGEDTEFGKPAASMVSLNKEPFYLVKFYPATWGSMGGVKTDIDSAAVLRDDGSVIEGLYAAGETSNRDFYNEVYIGAASLTFYTNMGRRAGTAAAGYVLK